MERLEMLRAAIRRAHERVEENSALSDEQHEHLQQEFADAWEAVEALASTILREATKAERE